MAYREEEEEEEEDYTFRLPTDLTTVPVLKLVSGLSWSTSQSDFDRVASFLSTSLDALHSNLAALTSTHTQLDQDYSALKSSYAQLHEDNSGLKSTCDQLEEENSALESSNAQLEQEKSALESRCAHIEHENSVLKSSYEQLRQENAGIRTSYEELEKERSALKVSYEQLQQDNSVLKAGCDHLGNNICALKSNNATLKRNNRVLKSKYGVVQKKNIVLASELEPLKSSCMQLEPLKMKCGVLENEVERLKSDLESVKSGYTKAVKEKSPVPVLEQGSENSEVKSGEKSLSLENGRIITESMIRQIFSPYGDIVDIELMEDQSSLSKGLCFVRYSKKESAIDVKRHKNELEMGGKRIGVDLSLDQNGLFFGNLRKAFRDVLSVESAMNLVPEVSSGLKRCSNRGFAFVHFSSHEAAAHAYHIGSHPDFTLGGDLHPLIEWYLPQAEFDLAEMAKSKVAYVGILPPPANEEYLRELFGRIGKVDKIVLSRKTFGMVGYLHFATRKDLERAIEEMNGRTVGAPDGGPPFKIKVEVAKIPAKGKVHTGDGVIKVQIKSLNMSNKRRDYSPDAPVIKARRVDKMVTGIDSLPPVLKDRLLRVFNLRIATEHDIDLHCMNGLKELPEASAISVLDQFLFSGADKHDKRYFFNSLVAEKRKSRSTSSSSPHQSDYSLRVPLDEDCHHCTRSHMRSFSPVSAERGRIRH